MPHALRHLLDTLCTVSVEVDQQTLANPDNPLWNDLPTSAGVVLFNDPHGRPLLIRAIGDPRAFVRRRLDPDQSDDTPTARTDYAAITKRIRVLPTGHTLLAELLASIAEAALDLDAAEATARRLSGCVVRCDPTARLPMFSVQSLADLWRGSVSIGPHDALIGPFAGPKRARRWTEMVIDLFDLCRYDHLLAQTPSATACVYKQMGKCPAPCDGSEPLESYRERFRSAALFYGPAARAELDRCTQRMQEAASQLRFEEAAALKDRIAAIGSLDTGGPWEVADPLSTDWRIRASASRTGWTRLSSLSATALTLHHDIRAAQDHDPPFPDPPPPASAQLVTGPITWLLLDVLLERLRSGLAAGEQVQQATISSDG